jgi:acetylornithine deacetylase/succinyl-diaminopimelate desuccinylase-like protein
LRTTCIPIVAGLLACVAASAQDLGPEQKLFRDIYQELVEINTTDSAGDTTRAARALERRLLDAGLRADEVEVFEPYPRKGNLVVRVKGTGAKKPVLLLGHLDVVEAKREDWKTDPFTLLEKDGYFTARGAADDKAMAASLVSILGQLRREGYKPARDIVLALTADEEMGDVPSNGVYWLVNNRKELLAAEFGINEGGGGELRQGKPFVQRIQVAEKIYTTFELEARNPGGHSSVPRRDNAIYELAGAVARIGAHRFPVKLAEVTRVYFERSAAVATGRLAADMRAVARGDRAAAERLSRTPFYNAQLRTTCVATRLAAGHADNALPQSAKATVNCRILPYDDPQEVELALRRLAGDKVGIRWVNKPLPSPASPLLPGVIGVVEGLTSEMWPGVPVVPSMSTGATDSRFLRNIGVPMYGLSGIFTEPGDSRAHGLDERVPVQRLYEGREFLYRLVKRLAQ